MLREKILPLALNPLTFSQVYGPMVLVGCRVTGFHSSIFLSLSSPQLTTRPEGLWSEGSELLVMWQKKDGVFNSWFTPEASFIHSCQSREHSRTNLTHENKNNIFTMWTMPVFSCIAIGPCGGSVRIR